MQIGGSGLGHGLDVGPVLGAIEERLEHQQFGRAEDRDGDAGKRDPLDVEVRDIVKAVGREEQIDRGVVPEHPDLAVTFAPSQIVAVPGHSGRERREHALDVRSGDKRVDIDVTRTPWLCGVEGERERSPKCMRNPGFRERRFERHDSLDQ